MKRSAAVVVMVAFFGAWLCACASAGRGGHCDLAESDWLRLRAATPLRAHIRLHSGDQDLGLDVVARMNGLELVVVGLTHYGVRLFVVRQDGESVRIAGAGGTTRERLAFQVLDALLLAFGGRADEKEAVAIRYSRSGPGSRFEIDQPRCGYEASVVGVSENLSTGERVLPEGVEP